MSDELGLFDDDEGTPSGHPTGAAPAGEGPGADGGQGDGDRADGDVGDGDRGGGRRADSRAPLAARMRPRTLDQVRGQAHLVGPDAPLGRMLAGGELSSCILWGPPGSGKTTLARLLARRADAAFVQFSAVTEGVARVREIIAEARTRLQATGRGTILFCDEIHRFNRAQQDAFLPHVEDGTVILVGATTENPSFEVNRPLLSRAPVFILNPLDEDDLAAILRDALDDPDRGLGAAGVEADDEALVLLARGADGDARRALGALEAAVRLVTGAPDPAGTGPGSAADPAESPLRITLETAREALQHRFAIYDKSGEEHFNLISALHKAVRGGDADGALYWLARMIRGGEDPLYVARRLVRMATEDIGLADPAALEVTVAAWQAYHFLGSPEGELALAEAVAYLASSPKSNRVYTAWKGALAAAEETASEPVPMHIRNAPTREMKAWGYGKGYRYDPEEAGGVAPQHYLPPALEGRGFYRPGGAGFEAEVRERLDEFARRRRGRREEGDAREGPPPADDG